MATNDDPNTVRIRSSSCSRLARRSDAAGAAISASLSAMRALLSFTSAVPCMLAQRATSHRHPQQSPARLPGNRSRPASAAPSARRRYPPPRLSSASIERLVRCFQRLLGLRDPRVSSVILAVSRVAALGRIQVFGIGGTRGGRTAVAPPAPAPAHPTTSAPARRDRPVVRAGCASRACCGNPSVPRRA